MPDLDPAAVAARAYALYVRRGQQPGRAVEDWIEAERQLREEAQVTRVQAPAKPSATRAEEKPAKKKRGRRRK